MDVPTVFRHSLKGAGGSSVLAPETLPPHCTRAGEAIVEALHELLAKHYERLVVLFRNQVNPKSGSMQSSA